jgi:ABC-type transport system involved in cytochrome c biogenesis permease subunit
MTHAHITAWFVAIILFLVALSFQKKGKDKPLRIVQMILRLFYLLILGTGLALLFSISTISPLYIVKTVLGIWVIASLEMILVRGNKGESTRIFWIQGAVAFVLVVFLGFKLPLGFYL